MSDTDYTAESSTSGDNRIETIRGPKGGVLCERIYDKDNRLKEMMNFDETSGGLVDRTIYQYDLEQSPLLTQTYNANGKLVFEKKRGCRPQQW